MREGSLWGPRPLLLGARAPSHFFRASAAADATYYKSPAASELTETRRLTMDACSNSHVDSVVSVHHGSELCRYMIADLDDTYSLKSAFRVVATTTKGTRI